MRDDQVRRYARHILLPDLGGRGQRALLAATAQLELGAPAASPAAAMIAATYLAAGGVGRLAVGHASETERAVLASHGPDTEVTASASGPVGTVELHDVPAWWPAAPGDDEARAFWIGAHAATRWMADVANSAHERGAHSSVEGGAEVTR